MDLPSGPHLRRTADRRGNNQYAHRTRLTGSGPAGSLLLQITAYSSVPEYMAVLQDPDARADELQIIAKYAGSWERRARTLRHPNIGHGFLVQTAQHPEVLNGPSYARAVQVELLRNPALPQEAAAAIWQQVQRSQTGEYGIIASIWRRYPALLPPNAEGDPDWVAVLKGPAVWRQAAAACSGCPPQVIERLAQDRHSQVRAVVATRRHCAPSIYRSLAVDQKLDVQLKVAYNKDCPPDTLATFAGREPEKDGAGQWYHFKIAASRNRRCPPEALERLSQDQDTLVRAAVASNKECPPETLQRLLRDPNTTVSETAERNPALPLAVLAMWQLAHQ